MKEKGIDLRLKVSEYKKMFSNITKEEQEAINIAADNLAKEIDKDILGTIHAEALIGDDKNKAILYCKSKDKYLRKKSRQILKGK